MALELGKTRFEDGEGSCSNGAPKDDDLTRSMKEELRSKRYEPINSVTILRVPNEMRKKYPDAFSPKVVSIGPFHRSRKNVQHMQHFKWHYLGKLLSRKPEHDLQRYVNEMKKIESKARSCYEGNIQMDSQEFVKMMVLDGCFIIQLLLQLEDGLAPDDPIYCDRWTLPRVAHDMLLLENQLPFFVLEKLLWVRNDIGFDYLLANCVLKFFQNLLPEEHDLELPPVVHHILHLMHSSLTRKIPTPIDSPQPTPTPIDSPQTTPTPTHHPLVLAQLPPHDRRSVKSAALPQHPVKPAALPPHDRHPVPLAAFPPPDRRPALPPRVPLAALSPHDSPFLGEALSPHDGRPALPPHVPLAASSPHDSPLLGTKLVAALPSHDMTKLLAALPPHDMPMSGAALPPHDIQLPVCGIALPPHDMPISGAAFPPHDMPICGAALPPHDMPMSGAGLPPPVMPLLLARLPPHDTHSQKKNDSQPATPQTIPTKATPKTIPTVTELQEAGVKFKRKKDASSILDIKFEGGVMKMPRLTISDDTDSLFRNFIAFEQCLPWSRDYFTSYCFFMDSLINTPRDVQLLYQSDIIEHVLGSDEEVAILFNKLCKGITWDSKRSFLADVFIGVEEYRLQKWHQWRAKLIRDYFSNPWAIISFAAAIFVIILTILQTFFTTFAYFRPPRS